MLYIAQLVKASDTQAVGHGFEPRPDQYNISYNNISSDLI